MAFSAQFLRSTSHTAANGIKTLVYGGSGNGKTRLIGTAPSPVILSAEGGLLSLRKMNLPFAEIHTIQQLRECYNWALSSYEARQFLTIGLDSISEIMETVLKTEMAKNKDGRKAYGELIIQGVEIVKSFRDLTGYHIVVTAKEEWTKDDSAGRMIYAPSLPGSKLGPQLPYLFDEVFQACVFSDPQTKQRSEWLRTRTDGNSIAKDRSGALDDWEVPNLSAIFAKIMKS